MLKRSICLFLLAAAAFSLSAFQLVENRKPVCSIFIDSKAPYPVKFAASELQRWVKYITGAELPVKKGKAPQSEPSITIAVAPTGFAGDTAKLAGKGGYCVRKRGNQLWLFAASGPETITGVYRFLYKNTDIIWARPDEKFGTVVTHSADLRFRKYDYCDIPDMSMRGWLFYPARREAMELWQMRQGANTGAWMHRRYGVPDLRYYNRKNIVFAGHHNIVRLFMPGKKYFDKHPEYYPLVGGRRMNPKDGGKIMTNLCFGNQEMTREFLRNLDHVIKRFPNYDNYGINIEDSRVFCECRLCMADIVLPNGKIIRAKNDLKLFKSTRFYTWLNEIAGYMQKKYPEKRIRTLAYYFTETPPACNLKSNIDIAFAPIFRDGKRPLEHDGNIRVADRLKMWSKRCKGKLILREYYGLTREFPRPADAVASQDWRFLQKLGSDSFYAEMTGDFVRGSWRNGVAIWSLNNMYFWCLANSSWDIDRPIDSLRREFLSRVFGEAADDLYRFYSAIEQAYVRSPGISEWHDEARASWKKCFTIDPDLKKKLAAALAAAEKKKMPANGRIMFDMLKKEYFIQVEKAESSVPGLSVTCKPEFDPQFSKGDWKHAPVITNLRSKFSPNEPMEKTDIRILIDKNNIYFGFRCHDRNGKNVYAPPRGLPRDVWSKGNRIDFCFAVSGKDQYQIVFDCNGNIFDSRNRNRKWNFKKLDLQLAKDDGGWSALVTIPLAEIGFVKNDTLSAAFIRYYWKDHTGIVKENMYYKGNDTRDRFCYSEIKFSKKGK